MKIYLEDLHCQADLSPLTLTRHTADIRIGILTIRDKWKMLTDHKTEIITNTAVPTDAIIIPSNFIPTINNFKNIIDKAKEGTLNDNDDFIKKIRFPWDIFKLNDWALRNDFELLTENRSSQKIDNNNRCLDSDRIFIEEGAKVNMSMLNAETGPIYIGKHAEIMEGAMIRGPFAMLDHSVVKMGAKIYGATTMGKHSVAGGEIKNSVLFDYSNKAHDGYLGDSVIGSWCNLGAGTTNSNLKNNAAEVSYQTVSGQQFNAGIKAGLIMGDYSRSAINTAFNTGTIIGVCCNIFGDKMPEKLVTDFSWGLETYELEKAIRDIDNWKKMKNQLITDNEISILKNLYALKK